MVTFLTQIEIKSFHNFQFECGWYVCRKRYNVSQTNCVYFQFNLVLCNAKINESIELKQIRSDLMFVPITPTYRVTSQRWNKTKQIESEDQSTVQWSISMNMEFVFMSNFYLKIYLLGNNDNNAYFSEEIY